MNKKNNFLLILYIVFLISFIGCSREKKNIIGSDGGGGSQGPKMTISYTRNSKNPSGTGASRTAVWIENSSGVLIRTLYRSVGGTYSEITRLSNWEAKSGKQSNNTTDTYTSATVNGGTSGSSYQWTWNLKDSSGNIVPDGDYKITIEISRYTNTNTAYYQFVLTKGQVSANTSVSVTQTAPNDMLQSLSGSYTP